MMNQFPYNALLSLDEVLDMQRWIVLRFPLRIRCTVNTVTVQLYYQLAPYKDHAVHCTLYHVSDHQALRALLLGTI